MSNPLLALLNKAGSQLSPSASAKAPENVPPSPSPLPPSPPSAPSSLASPSSAGTAVNNGSRSPTGLSGLLSPGHASPPAYFAPHASLLSLLSTANPPATPTRSAESLSSSIEPSMYAAGPSKTPSAASRSVSSGNALGSGPAQEPASPASANANASARLLELLAGSAMSSEPVKKEEHSMTTAPAATAEQSHPTIASSQTSYAHAAAQPSKFDFSSSFDQFLPEAAPTQKANTSNSGSTRRPAEPKIKQEEAVPGTGPAAAASSIAPQSIPGPAPSNTSAAKKDVRVASDRVELKQMEVFLASKHVTALHREQSFAQASTSGLSQTQHSPTTITTDLDLAAPQPAGIDSLYPAKLEIAQLALVSSPFEHHVSDVFSAGVQAFSLLAQLHTSKITNLGNDVVAYAMNKGRIRLLDSRTGERTMLQVPHKRPIISITAFAASDESDWRVLAVFDRSEDGKPDGIFAWKVTLDGSFQSEALPSISSRMSDYRLLACQEGSEYSYDAHLCALVDSAEAATAHLIPDLTEWSQSTQAQAGVSHKHQVVAAAIASQHSAYIAIEVGSGSGTQVAIQSSTTEEKGLCRFDLPPLDNNHEGHLPISFIAPVYPQNSENGDGFPAVLVGFARNTVIGLLDVRSGWRCIWRFKNMPSNHFNLVHFSEEASTLFLANSVRSSLFTVQLPITSGHHQWSLRSPLRWTEYALPQPCTSFSVTKKQGDDAAEGFKVFAAHPGGVHSFEIPLFSSGSPLPSPLLGKGNEQASTELTSADEPKRAEVVKVGQTTDVPQGVQTHESAPASEVHDDLKLLGEQPRAADDAIRDQASSSLEPGEATMQFSELPTADMLPFSRKSPSPLSTRTAVEAPAGSISMVEQGRTHSSRRGTRGGSKNKKAVVSEDGTHSRTASANLADLPANGIANGKDDANSRPANESEPRHVGSDSVALQKHLQSMESRLTDKLGKMISSSANTAPAVELPQSALSTIASEVAKNLSADVTSAVVPQVLASLQSVTQNEMRRGFSEAVQQHLPAELSKLIDRPDVHNNISRAVSAGVVPVAQRTAVEVVTQVLAPHFEQTMLGVAQRVEAMIGSGFTEVRKSIVAEQSTALKATEQSIAEMSSALTLLSKQVRDLSTQNEALSKTVEELRRSGANREAREAPPPPSSTASLARHFSPGHPQSPWIPIESFQSPFAQPSSFGGPGGPPYPSHPPYGGLPSAYGPSPPTPLSYQTARGAHNSASQGPPAPRPSGGDEAVEDELLSALSSPNSEMAILPVLQRLKVQYGRPEAALLQRDADTGMEKLSVSQPVLLALLNTLSNIAKPGTSGNAVSGGRGPEVFVPWAEACAMRLDIADDRIKAAYARVQEKIRRGFEEAWTEHHVKVDSMWWSRARLDTYLLRFLPVA